MSVISCPFSNVSWIPCRTVSIPSVTMMEGIRPYVTSRPFVSPRAVPSSSVRPTPAATGQCAWVGDVSCPSTAASRPSCAPTEMSISPRTITKVSPQATMTVGAADTSMSRRLPGATKAGLISPTASSVSSSRPRTPHSRRQASRNVGSRRAVWLCLCRHAAPADPPGSARASIFSSVASARVQLARDVALRA